jgi:anion-transporting  ArsA/GET3 family ATPase
MTERTPANFTPLLEQHRIIVCVGSGGVGKTTVSAAFALWGALHGRRTAVLTIDPAKRLAACLGLASGRVREQVLTTEAFSLYGLSPSGSLTALLVDQQSAWDAVVERYVPTPEVRQRIFTNPFYLGLSRTFAGSHEYMALDTLATLVQRDAYDLIVVDTPPTRQALDFLEAPQRVQRFLDSPVSKWFIRPSVSTGWAAFSAVNRTATFLLRKIEAATGVATLGDISEFFTAMQQMFADFGHRLMQMNQLLASPQAAFILVTRPDAEVLAEAETFLAGLQRLHIPLRGLVVNGVYGTERAEPTWRGDVLTLAERLRQVIVPRIRRRDLLRQLAENFLAHQTLIRGEQRRLSRFYRLLPPGVLSAHVPVIPAFPADLGGLLLLHQHLFAVPRTQQQGRAADRMPEPSPAQRKEEKNITKSDYSPRSRARPRSSPP